MSIHPVAHTNQLALFTDEEGLTTIEYVIILVLIAAAAVITWQQFGATILAKLNASNTAIVNMEGEEAVPPPESGSLGNENTQGPPAAAHGQLPVSKRH